MCEAGWGRIITISPAPARAGTRMGVRRTPPARAVGSASPAPRPRGRPVRRVTANLLALGLMSTGDAGHDEQLWPHRPHRPPRPNPAEVGAACVWLA